MYSIMGGKVEVQVVIIGIGSASFGRKTLADLLGRTSMSDLSLHLVLVDTNPRNLDIMMRLTQRLKAHFNSSAIVEATGERSQALPRVPIERMAAHASGERPLDNEATNPSEEMTVPIIAAISRCSRISCQSWTKGESWEFVGVSMNRCNKKSNTPRP